jgi:hypothetical protein
MLQKQVGLRLAFVRMGARREARASSRRDYSTVRNIAPRSLLTGFYWQGSPTPRAGARSKSKPEGGGR